MNGARWIVFGCALAVALGIGVPAAGADESITVDLEKERGQLLQERTYERLFRVQRLMEDEDVEGALQQLDILLQQARGHAFDTAVAHQTYGNILLQQGREREALRHFLAALRPDILPLRSTRNVLYLVTQLKAMVEDFRGCLYFFGLWETTLEMPLPPEASVLAATAHVQLDEYREAVPRVRYAIDHASEPRETWYQFLIALHYELRDHRECIEVLQRAARHWPDNKEYWKNLSALHQMLEEPAEALSALEIAYRRGLLDREEEYRTLAQLYGHQEVPYKAARALAAGMERGIVERTFENLRALGNAWMAARETGRAIEAYEAATSLAPSPVLDLTRAQLLIEREGWEEAVRALEAVAAAPDFETDISNPGAVFLLWGLAEFERGRLEESEQAFRRAESYERTEEEAREWIRAVEAEKIGRGLL
ncbi:MAG: hypothetical protein EA425_06730 [Puniceicoccaceae bacterium]|nr:MAG: hypothetical protein EA425_06730 [Puniceicoccaceae bacterium]